jgi:hypothetical protein
LIGGFNFYPLTAVMIVMLALLNDGAILSIAYDNVLYKNAPEAWNMRLVLGIATVLGLIGPVAAFGLFYLGDRVFHLDHPHIQTMMYLMLSVAGHLTIFQTRTRGPWWSTRPAWILLAAVCGTQAAATLISVYAFVWFFVTDPMKLLAYWILDPAQNAPAGSPEGGQFQSAGTTRSKPGLVVFSRRGGSHGCRFGSLPIGEYRLPPSASSFWLSAAAVAGSIGRPIAPPPFTTRRRRSKLAQSSAP